MSGPLLGEEEVLALLDTEHTGWKSDREGWVTLELRGVTWRVHYRRGRLLEIGWWGLLDDAGGVRRRAGTVAERSRPPAA